MSNTTLRLRIQHEQSPRTRMAARTCPACARGGGLVHVVRLEPGQPPYRCRYCGATAEALATVPAVEATVAAAMPGIVTAVPRRRALMARAVMAAELAARVYTFESMGGNLFALLHKGEEFAGVAVATSSFCLLSWCDGHPKLPARAEVARG